MKNKELDIDSLNNKNDGLIFKEHREFFINFFQKRDDFLSAFALAKYDEEELKDSYNILVYLIESTSAYIFKEDIEKEIDNELEEIEKILKDNSQHQECYNKIKELHRKVSSLQVQAEILPKPILSSENEQEKFWRGEDNKAMKEMKKAFYDVVMKY